MPLVLTVSLIVSVVVVLVGAAGVLMDRSGADDDADAAPKQPSKRDNAQDGV